MKDYCLNKIRNWRLQLDNKFSLLNVDIFCELDSNNLRYDETIPNSTINNFVNLDLIKVFTNNFY